MSIRILHGDCREVLRTLSDESVNCIVTSPPYWNLRDYGVDGQIGLEASVDEWVDELVGVFREARRVLRSDGVAWINLGDSYAGGHRSSYDAQTKNVGNLGPVGLKRRPVHDLKPKNLIGQPWRVAFALQADGWYWRDTIVWAKRNPMPESVSDRCTKAWEPVLMMTRSERYFFDAEAIKEPASENTNARLPGNVKPQDDVPGLSKHNNRSGLHAYAERQRGRVRKDQVAHAGMSIQSGLASKVSHHPTGKRNASFDEAMAVMPDRRNKRNVWDIASEPFSGAHFATFPTALVEPCILAGCPAGGVVLDPFGGAGTTGLVADRLQRDAVLIEINPQYAEMARRRILGDAPLFAEVIA